MNLIEQAKIDNSLKEVSISIASIKTKEDFEKFTNRLMKKFKRVNLKNINSLLLNSICNQMVAKLCFFIKDVNFSYSKIIVNFVEFFVENTGICPEYKKQLNDIYRDIQDKQYQLKKSEVKDTKFPNQNLFKDYSNNLTYFFKSFNKLENNFHKNFGYSLLDLNGDFIWSDNNAERLFEIKQDRNKVQNFFKLLIPFSTNQLFSKYCNDSQGIGDLFRENHKVGSFINFSYVVYSKKNMGKFLKFLKKKNVIDLNDVPLGDKKKDADKDIFYKYLKALSSRASLVVLNYTRTELRAIFDNQDFNISQLKSFQTVLKSSIESFSSEENIKSKNSSEDESPFYQLAVFLETRLSKNIPCYNFDRMKDDQKIQAFRNLIQKRLRNHQKKHKLN